MYTYSEISHKVIDLSTCGGGAKKVIRPQFKSFIRPRWNFDSDQSWLTQVWAWSMRISVFVWWTWPWKETNLQINDILLRRMSSGIVRFRWVTLIHLIGYAKYHTEYWASEAKNSWLADLKWDQLAFTGNCDVTIHLSSWGPFALAEPYSGVEHNEHLIIYCEKLHSNKLNLKKALWIYCIQRTSRQVTSATSWNL